MNAQDVLTNIASEFPYLHSALIVITAFVGLVFVGLSIFGLATYHKLQRQGESILGPIMRGIAGAMLLGIGATVSVQTVSLLGATDPRRILDYAEPTGSEAAMLVTVLVGIMVLFGWIGIAKGWILLGTMGKGPGGDRDGKLWNGLVHLFAGTLAANITAMTDVVAATAGVSNYLRHLIPN